MCDLFLKQDAAALLANKTVFLAGDSNTRGLYKDILTLITSNSMIKERALKSKMEHSYCNDTLCLSGDLNKGRDYREERRYLVDNFHIHFYFLTQCYNDYFEKNVIPNIQKFRPDVFIMNSCVWDITRWGPQGVEQYKENMKKLMKRLKEVLPQKCLFIWLCSMPLSSEMRGGFLIPQVEFMRHQIRFEIMEANLYAWEIVNKHGFDILDLHYYMQMDINKRAADGIHWQCDAVRYVTNTVLTHICLSWGNRLPGHLNNKQLENLKSAPMMPDVPELTDKKENKEAQENKPVTRKLLRPFRRANDRR